MQSSQLMIALFLVVIFYVYFRLSIRLDLSIRRALRDLEKFKKILTKITEKEEINTKESAEEAQKNFRLNKGKIEFIKMIEENNLFPMWRQFSDNLSYEISGLSVYISPNFSDTFFNFERLKDKAIPVNVSMGTSVLTGIGVVGTFLGLSIGVGGASSGLASPDIQVARSAMSELLSGAQLAFITSLAGLFFSLVLRLKIARKADKLRERMHALENYVAGFIVTKDASVSSLGHLSEISKNLKSDGLNPTQFKNDSSVLEIEVRRLVAVLEIISEDYKNAGR